MNAETREWHESAKADFTGYRFAHDADFNHFHFPGDAVFERANFGERAVFNSVEFHGRAEFSNAKFRGPCSFPGAIFEGTAKFNDTFFGKNADFGGAQFFNSASFRSAKFRNEAKFAKTQFRKDSFFLRSIFSDTALFVNAQFSADVNFRDAIFCRLVIVENTTFLGDVIFDRGVFKGTAHFTTSSFNKSAAFKAITGEGVFSLYSLQFSRLPDFTEAHFKEAPLFDNVELDPERFRNIPGQNAETSLQARWRTLKRLAIQGHDHERELLFSQGEIIARRGTQDTWRHLRFWAGWGYQILSNFGRSMSLPLFWLGLSFLAFALFYFCQSYGKSPHLFAGSVPCLAGPGDLRSAAAGLSFHHAIPFAGIGSPDVVKQFHACLYGIHETSSLAQNPSPYGFQTNTQRTTRRLLTGFTPLIPHGVASVGKLQTILSATLIFLFILAIRNHFRIK